MTARTTVQLPPPDPTSVAAAATRSTVSLVGPPGRPPTSAEIVAATSGLFDAAGQAAAAQAAAAADATAKVAAQHTADNGIYVAGRKTSTDGSHGLSAPTGVGLEFVFTAAGLDDIRYDGVSQ